MNSEESLYVTVGFLYVVRDTLINAKILNLVTEITPKIFFSISQNTWVTFFNVQGTAVIPGISGCPPKF